MTDLNEAVQAGRFSVVYDHLKQGGDWRELNQNTTPEQGTKAYTTSLLLEAWPHAANVSGINPLGKKRAAKKLAEWMETKHKDKSAIPPSMYMILAGHTHADIPILFGGGGGGVNKRRTRKRRSNKRRSNKRRSNKRRTRKTRRIRRTRRTRQINRSNRRKSRGNNRKRRSRRRTSNRRRRDHS